MVRVPLGRQVTMNTRTSAILTIVAAVLFGTRAVRLHANAEHDRALRHHRPRHPRRNREPGHRDQRVGTGRRLGAAQRRRAARVLLRWHDSRSRHHRRTEQRGLGREPVGNGRRPIDVGAREPEGGHLQRRRRGDRWARSAAATRPPMPSTTTATSSAPPTRRTTWRSRAFLYRNGTMKSLGTLGGANSVATAINESARSPASRR